MGFNPWVEKHFGVFVQYKAKRMQLHDVMAYLRELGGTIYEPFCPFGPVR